MNEILLFDLATIHVRFISNFALEKISELLQKKGLDAEIAMKRAQEVFFNESEKASLFLHNLTKVVDGNVMRDIYQYIAQRALLQSPIDFYSYDQLVGMIQRNYKMNMSEEELEKIRQIAQANRIGVIFSD